MTFVILRRYASLAAQGLTATFTVNATYARVTPTFSPLSTGDRIAQHANANKGCRSAPSTNLKSLIGGGCCHTSL